MMLSIRKTAALTAAGALIATPLALGAAGSAIADDGPEKTKRFTVAGAPAKFHVEKDDGHFEVEVDVDRAKPGSKWRVVLRHGGKTFFKRTLTADREGEVEVDRNRPNTAGADKLKVTVKKVGGPKKSRTIKMR